MTRKHAHRLTSPRPSSRMTAVASKRATKKRRRSMRKAKFALGQVVRHRFYPFRGVVFDIDPDLQQFRGLVARDPGRDSSRTRTSRTIICSPRTPRPSTSPTSPSRTCFPTTAGSRSGIRSSVISSSRRRTGAIAPCSCSRTERAAVARTRLIRRPFPQRKTARVDSRAVLQAHKRTEPISCQQAWLPEPLPALRQRRAEAAGSSSGRP